MTTATTVPDAANAPRKARLSPAARRWITIGAWLVATGMVVAAFHTIGWRKTFTALARADARWLALAVLANLGIIALWALQTRVFLPRGHHVAYGRLFEVQALTTTATNTAPAGFGEAAGIAALAERGGVGAAAALSVFAQHHLVEGIAKLATITLAARFAPLPPWVHRSLVALTGLVAAATVALLALAHRADRPPTDAAPATTRLARAGAFVRHWASGLVAMRSPVRFAAGLAIALGMKATEALGWFAVQHAFGLSLAASVPLLALVAVNLASTVSATPGNIGVYEAAAFLIYTRHGASHDLALATAVTGHLCYLLPMAGLGYLLLSVRGVQNAIRRRS